jgi:hypothetical protein
MWWAVYDGGCGGHGSESVAMFMDGQIVRLVGCCAGENGLTEGQGIQ